MGADGRASAHTMRQLRFSFDIRPFLPDYGNDGNFPPIRSPCVLRNPKFFSLCVLAFWGASVMAGIH